METKDVLTLVGLAISLIGLVISLVKLAYEQHKANELKQKELDAQGDAQQKEFEARQKEFEARQKELDAQLKAQKRTEYKLRLYQLLIGERMNFGQLVSKFRENSPLSEIDQVELRKCIYEMLVERTLVSFENKTYSAYTMDEDDEDEDDEDEDDEDEDA